VKIRLRRSVVATSALLIVLILAVTPSFADTLYSNGPINGTIDGYTVYNGLNIANSFTLSSASTITSFDAGLWVFPGNTPLTGSWRIGTAPSFEGATLLFSGTGTFSSSYWGKCSWGFDIDTATMNLSGVSLGAGTYYLGLYNVTSSFGSVYWDENDGPSAAYYTWYGVSNPMGSEAFNIYGTTAATPEPGTLLMFGTGALGLFGAFRRRFSI